MRADLSFRDEAGIRWLIDIAPRPQDLEAAFALRLARHLHLAQALGISQNQARYAGGNIADQFQAFFGGTQAERTDRFLERLTQVEFLRFESHFSRFDLGEIQNVVDHRKQGVRRLFNHAKIITLLVVQFCLKC